MCSQIYPLKKLFGAQFTLEFLRVCTVLVQVLVQLALAEEHFFTLFAAKHRHPSVGQRVLDVSAAARQDLATLVTHKLLRLLHLNALVTNLVDGELPHTLHNTQGMLVIAHTLYAVLTCSTHSIHHNHTNPTL